MGKAATDPSGGQKMIPADCVSVLLMALGSSTISKAQFDMMSALDGTRTASSFEHQFRPITAKAKDLKARADAGERFVPVQPSKKRSDKPSAPSQKRKNDATGLEQVTAKKAKPAPKPRGKKDSPPVKEPDNNSSDANFPKDANDFIKNEQDWEEEEFA